MHIGAVFPHEIELDEPSDLSSLVMGLEAIGFDYLTVFDHVGGAPASQLGDLPVVPYTNESPFFEALVLLGYTAAVTTTLGLSTGVLVLPQRPVVLAAKQLATIDQISGGRLRVGLGVGWNPAEYEALGVDFARRGDVLDEQVTLLRSLWTDELVATSSDLHRWTGIGLEPRPATCPPIWFGGISPRVLRRVAQMGDGWIPPMIDTESGAQPDFDAALARLDQMLDDAGRSRKGFGIEGRVRWNPDTQPRSAVSDAGQIWQTRGATHFAVAAGLDATGRRVGDYLDAFASAKDALAL